MVRRQVNGHDAAMAAKSFLATGAATAAAAVIGSAATDVDSAWYRGLDLPDWQPPGGVIGPVWTVLYGLIAATTGRAWNRSGPQQRRRLATALGINLCLNAAWPWVFFRGHRPALGVAVITGLEASTVVLTREVARSDRKAAVALMPYLGWNAFALGLNATIAARNKRTKATGR
jgi:translocator protein